MRVKPVPAPPEATDRLFEIRNAVPLVPEPEGSCCERLIQRTVLDETGNARDWLAFLRGLGLVEGSSGYHRTRDGPDDDDLATALLEGIYGARELYQILADAERPLSADDVFDRFEAVPRWERHRNPDWRSVWRERVERLLGWLVLFGLAEHSNREYTASASASGK